MTILPWLGWLVASIIGLFQFTLQTSTSVMINDLGSAFTLSTLGVSLLSSSFFYTYLVCQIPAGILIDYIKPRRLLIICQLLLGLACFLFASAHTITAAVAARILMGLFAAPSIVAALYLAARTLPTAYFAFVLGLTEMLGMLGGVVGEALLARSVTHFGWRDTMLLCAMVAIGMAILAWIFVRDRIRGHEPMAAKAPHQHFWHDFFALLALPQAWINGLYAGLTFGLIAGFGAFWCIPFLTNAYDISLAEAADASSMIFVGAAIGTPLVGWLSDYLESRRILMVLCAAIACLIATLVIYMTVSYAWMCFLLLLLGLFAGAYLLPFAVMRDLTPTHMHGTAMGYTNMMCILIGSPLLQPLIGWILHHQGDTAHPYHHALIVIPISLLLASILALKVNESP